MTPSEEILFLFLFWRLQFWQFHFFVLASEWEHLFLWSKFIEQNDESNSLFYSKYFLRKKKCKYPEPNHHLYIWQLQITVHQSLKFMASEQPEHIQCVPNLRWLMWKCDYPKSKWKFKERKKCWCFREVRHPPTSLTEVLVVTSQSCRPHTTKMVEIRITSNHRVSKIRRLFWISPLPLSLIMASFPKKSLSLAMKVRRY